MNSSQTTGSLPRRTKKDFWIFWDRVWVSGAYDLSEDEKMAVNGLYNVVLRNPPEEEFLRVLFSLDSEIRSEWRLEILALYKSLNISDSPETAVENAENIKNIKNINRKFKSCVIFLQE